MKKRKFKLLTKEGYPFNFYEIGRVYYEDDKLYVDDNSILEIYNRHPCDWEEVFEDSLQDCIDELKEKITSGKYKIRCERHEFLKICRILEFFEIDEFLLVNCKIENALRYSKYKEHKYLYLLRDDSVGNRYYFKSEIGIRDNTRALETITFKELTKDFEQFNKLK